MPKPSANYFNLRWAYKQEENKMFNFWKKKTPVEATPMPKPSYTFQYGDVVRYTSGSPDMTIEYVIFNHENYSPGREVVCCSWFSKSAHTFKEAWIAADCLYLVATRDEAATIQSGMQRIGQTIEAEPDQSPVKG